MGAMGFDPVNTASASCLMGDPMPACTRIPVSSRSP